MHSCLVAHAHKSTDPPHPHTRPLTSNAQLFGGTCAQEQMSRWLLKSATACSSLPAVLHACVLPLQCGRDASRCSLMTRTPHASCMHRHSQASPAQACIGMHDARRTTRHARRMHAHGMQDACMVMRTHGALLPQRHLFIRTYLHRGCLCRKQTSRRCEGKCRRASVGGQVSEGKRETRQGKPKSESRAWKYDDDVWGLGACVRALRALSHSLSLSLSLSSCKGCGGSVRIGPHSSRRLLLCSCAGRCLAGAVR
jgi:hypothetical protein